MVVRGFLESHEFGGDVFVRPAVVSVGVRSLAT
jgi:hypothetical protein